MRRKRRLSYSRELSLTDFLTPKIITESLVCTQPRGLGILVDWKTKMISVVIPAYNEENAISQTISSVREVLDKADFKNSEIIIVDDGSSDKTGKRAKAAKAKVIVNLQNMGYGFSLKSGITAAKNDTIVIIDADGTYPIKEIPHLVKIYKKGFHMVVGARTGKFFWGSLFKAPLRVLLRWLVEFTAGRRIPDVNSGLRVFSRKEVIPYFDHLSNKFSFTTTVTLAYMLTHKFVEYVAIDYRDRIGETKVNIFKDSLRVFQQIIVTGLFFNPLYIFLALTMATLIAAILSIAIGLAVSIVSAVWLGIGLITISIIVFAIGLFAQALKYNNIRSGSE
jgi:glycosyltransferase involved in cell wall biosynthesis